MTTARRTPLALACVLLCSAAAAQIRTDGSVGAAQTLSGPAYAIPQTLGRLSGGNLFHSFQAFNIGSRESATFSSGVGIANVISRVTGGDASRINGTLRLQAAEGAPGFFFINPAGITFGAGATINVPGAFHVATADYVKFPEGRFHADLSRASSFSSAAPEAFGFLGSQRATLAVQDGALLVARSPHGLVLAGGDISIDGASLAAAGDIQLAAVGGDAVEVPFTGVLPAVGGLLDMRNGAAVTTFAVNGRPGGRIDVTAGDLVMDTLAYLYSTHDAETSGDAAGGDVRVTVRGGLVASGEASISSDASGAGRAGNVSVQAAQVFLDSAAYVASEALEGSSGQAGDVRVQAAQVLLDGGAFVASQGKEGSSGRTGVVTVEATDAIVMRNGRVASVGNGGSGAVTVVTSGTLDMSQDSAINSFSAGAGDAGAVRVQAGALRMAGGSDIGSIASQGAGAAGAVDVTVATTADLSVGPRGPRQVQDGQQPAGGSIFSSSSLGGNASNVSVSAASLTLSNSGINSNAVGLEGAADVGDAVSGNIKVTVTGDVVLRGNSIITTSTLTRGGAGNVLLTMRDLTLSEGSSVASVASEGSGHAGMLDLSATRQVLLQGDSSLSTSTRTSGDAGTIRVVAPNVRLEGNSSFNSLATESSTGRGGSVSVRAAQALELRDGSRLSTVAGGAGDAGSVEVDAGRVLLDTRSSLSSATSITGRGAAGNVSVKTAGELRIDHDAFITSNAFGLGGAGAIAVQAGSVVLGNGGRISSDAFVASSGNAGRIDITASGDLLIANAEGFASRETGISTNSFSSGSAGAITVRAANIRIDTLPNSGIVSAAAAAGTGNAGNLDVQASGDVRITSGTLSTSTETSGTAGTLRLHAANITLQGAGATVLNAALERSSGNAGSIDVRASGDLAVRDGAITSTTAGAGAAGTVQVQAARLSIRGRDAGISAAATPGSGGQTGNVQVEASESIVLQEGGYISTANGATVSDPAARQSGRLSVSAPVITLQQGLITAASGGNVAASDITVAFSDTLRLDRGVISTSANAGNGGAIDIRGGQTVYLRQSGVTTSVQGVQGNGGDIAIDARSLVLENGFVQANTAARNASGGSVRIAVDSLIASGNSLLLGGDTPYVFQSQLFGFNVIQAAAPTGVSGVVQVTSPVLDVTGSLRGLGARVIDSGGLGRSLCQASGGSSLAQGGRGGLAPSAHGFLRAEDSAAPQAALRDEPPLLALAGLRTAPRGCL